MDLETVIIEKPRRHISVIKLNRPHRLNAMSAELISDIVEAFRHVGDDNDTWVAVLTGEGRGFCSGLDLEDPGVIPGVEGMSLPRMAIHAIEHYAQVVPAMRAMPQPVIAAVNGAAYGGGLCLAVGADVRIAAASAVFNATGIVNGLTSTELGISFLLPRLIGSARSNDILLTGRRFDAAEAERIGLVSRVVDDGEVLNTALEIAEGMCQFSPFGLVMTKRVLWDNLEVPGLQAAIDVENRGQILLGHTENLPECIRARKEKRKPVYTDEPRRHGGEPRKH
jgi:enoyl-CoA hydratase